MGRRVLIVGFIVVIAVVGAVVVTKAMTKTEDIFLEGVNDAGLHPFTNAAVVTPATTTTTTAVGTTTTSAAGATTTTAKTGLYGGSGNQKVCDPEKLIAFLEAHPDKAAAWVGALNADPTLKWSGETPLKVADIPAYIHELAPTFLAADTRVTNHGFFNGKATPHQSVLQKGTAVLVDKQGIPRARCACGNPLNPPKKVDHPHYKGHRWPGWEPPYCGPPGCTLPTTTTTSSTTTTVVETTTTTQCTQLSTQGGCGTTRKQGTTATTHKVTTTTARAVTVPKQTTTSASPNTTRRGGTTSTTQGGKP